MKTNVSIVWLIALLVGMPLGVSAQEKERPSLPREVPSPEKIAERETNEMKRELQLTEKQYKKVYKLNLKEQKKRFSVMQKSERPGPPPGGSHGMEGGRPPMMGGDFPMMDGAGPAGPEGDFRMKNRTDEIQKAVAAKQKKMKKILTTEQYEKWQKMDAKRKVRPSERPGKERESN